MKTRVLAFFVIFFVAFSISCKKKEEQQAQTEMTIESTDQQPAAPREERKKRGARPGKGAAADINLQLYNEDKLIATIPSTELGELATEKVKVGNREFAGISVKNLLSKYQLEGSHVNFTGANATATLSWEQISNEEIYLLIAPKGLRGFSSSAALSKVAFPKKVDRIMVGKAAQKAAKTGNGARKPKQKRGKAK